DLQVMSLTSYLAAPSRDLTMRHSARGGIVRGGRADSQGKFCLCLKFVLLWRRNALWPSDDNPFRH
ncbi:MAG: hypothetical protein WEB53_02510, partial [Akkermansiaceae bacterium]